jgi:predicted nucleic acid-binding Zn ribbon protein
MERLGDDARRLLAAAGAPGADRLAAITAVWRAAVGDAIARSAWPRRLARDGTLHVATTSSTWAFELDRLSGEILTRLREALPGDGTPDALRFAPGPVPDPSEEPPERLSAAVEPSPEARAAAGRLALPIEDPELRQLVSRAAAASLERTRSGRGFC